MMTFRMALVLLDAIAARFGSDRNGMTMAMSTKDWVALGRPTSIEADVHNTTPPGE